MGNRRRRIESEESEDDFPRSQRQKKKTPGTEGLKRKRISEEAESEIEDDSEEDRRKKKKSSSSSPSSRKSAGSSGGSPAKKDGRKAKAEEEPEEVREEAPTEGGAKWSSFQHNGPVFAPAYEPLPKDVKFMYDKRIVNLSLDAEEVAGFYARLIEHKCTTKEVFNRNFFRDWRKVMSPEERTLITDLALCDFGEISDFYKRKSDERKARSKEEKLAETAEKDRIAKEHGVCTVDGQKQEIGNFRVEPPGLFLGRGKHPKMGTLKTRVNPEDVVINCSARSTVPVPPPGHRWKEIRHDDTVTWLASWIANVQGLPKYIQLAQASELKGKSDRMKYEKARELGKNIAQIRVNYRKDFDSEELRVRQRAVAMYLLDKLALRAGKEKGSDEADTVGCCSLRVEHIQLHRRKRSGEAYVVEFDFLGKDSISYHNEVPIEKRVFELLKDFMKQKEEGEDLFETLTTAKLNKHLSDVMDGLTAKVFRTYKASATLERELHKTPHGGTVAEKLLAYNRANRTVALMCNHQRSAPNSHAKSMKDLDEKIQLKKTAVTDFKTELKRLTVGTPAHVKKEKGLKRAEEQLKKLQIKKVDKSEGKETALGTSKTNYLDPRITVAWCKKNNIQIKDVYSKAQRAKFRWAEMTDESFRFASHD